MRTEQERTGDTYWQAGRFIADFDGGMGLIRENLQPKTRGRIAVIGSGPAGLTIAGDLARKGF